VSGTSYPSIPHVRPVEFVVIPGHLSYPPALGSYIGSAVHHQSFLALGVERHVFQAGNGIFQSLLTIRGVHYEDAEQDFPPIRLHSYMRSFREFLQTEAGAATQQPLARGSRAYGQRASRAAGIYPLPDLASELQIGQTTVGGYPDFASAAQKLSQDIRYNAQYPIWRHQVDPSKIGFELKHLTYAQMYSQTIDLVSRIQAIGSVIASGGTMPGDPDLTARLRTAHFKGQAMGQPANGPNVDIWTIQDVDGRVFYGEVSGRGGTVGFKIGEALQVITPVTTPPVIPAHVAQQMQQDKAEEAQRRKNGYGSYGNQQYGQYGNQYNPYNIANMSAEATVNEVKAGRVGGSHFNINVRKLGDDLQLMLQIFGQFERGLQGLGQAGRFVDKVFTQLGREEDVPLLKGINPLKVK